jgi:hypothetical protein
MRKISLVLLFLLLMLLAVINPNEADFRGFMETRIEKENISGSDLEQSLRGLVSQPLSELMAESSQRSNYLIFSLFKIETANNKNLYIGIAGQFIPLKEEIGSKN